MKFDKGTKLKEKVRKSNKRYETRMKGKVTKLKEQVQNFNENMRNYETKRFFSFAKQLETLYFVFRETKKKYETVNPSHDTVRNWQVTVHDWFAEAGRV